MTRLRMTRLVAKQGRMMKNKIASLLKEADSIVIFPHIQMDGDALGSAVAICIGLRNLGKKAEILIEDKIPNNILFLDRGYCVYEKTIEKADIHLALDSSDEGRLGKRFDIYKNGPTTLMIDHHKTAKPFGQYNLVDAKASSTGEIVMDVIKAMGIFIDQDIGQALYTALVTDTGRFMYSNTSKKTHLQVAELYDSGMDRNRVALEIYQNKRPERIVLRNKILSTLEILFDGQACIAFMTEDMLVNSKAMMEETEGLVEELRNIEGVEIAAFLREDEDSVKATFRSKGKYDVSKIAQSFGGGGHKNAAGCSVDMPIGEFKEKVIAAIEKELKTWKDQE